tara:strand:- start:31 stop:1008 length:978 start_codon:yes stop_codon:yes gene_type:complete
MIDKRINQDISFSIVKPSKDGSRPGYRRGNYDGSGGGFGGPGKSDGPSGGDNNAPGDGGGSGREGGAEENRTRTTPTKTTTPTTTRHNPNTDDGFSTTSTPDTTTTTTTTPNFSIHDGPDTTPLYDDFPKVPTAPRTNYSVGLVPGVDYRYVQDPNSQYNKNINLNNQLLDTPYKGINTPFMSLNFLGNTIGKFGYDTNTKFFSDNSIGGKINPATGQPFGYGIDGYKAYMEQRSLGNVGAYGGTELSQNALNGRSGGDDGIMNVYNNPNDTDDGDADGDGDVDETDKFIFRYFDKTGKTLQAGAGGVEDLMRRIRQRLDNIFTT